MARKIELLFTDEEDICNAMPIIKGHCSFFLFTNNISIFPATASHVEARRLKYYSQGKLIMPCNDGHALLLFCRHGLRQPEQFHPAFCHNLSPDCYQSFFYIPHFQTIAAMWNYSSVLIVNYDSAFLESCHSGYTALGVTVVKQYTSKFHL